MPGAHRSGFHYFPAERNDLTGGNISITEAGSSENGHMAVPNGLGEGFTRPLPPFGLNQQPRTIGGAGRVVSVAGAGLVGDWLARGERLNAAFAPVSQGFIKLALNSNFRGCEDAFFQFVIGSHFSTSDHPVEVVMPLLPEGVSRAGFPVVTVPEFTAQSQFKTQQAIGLRDLVPRVLAAGITSARHLVGKMRPFRVGLALAELRLLRPIDGVASLLADAVPATLAVAENAQRVTDLAQGAKQQVFGNVHSRHGPERQVSGELNPGTLHSEKPHGVNATRKIQATGRASAKNRTAVTHDPSRGTHDPEIVAAGPDVDLVRIRGDGIPGDRFITNVTGERAVTLDAVAQCQRFFTGLIRQELDRHPAGDPVNQHWSPPTSSTGANPYKRKGKRALKINQSWLPPEKVGNSPRGDKVAVLQGPPLRFASDSAASKTRATS